MPSLTSHLFAGACLFRFTFATIVPPYPGQPHSSAPSSHLILTIVITVFLAREMNAHLLRFITISVPDFLILLNKPI